MQQLKSSMRIIDEATSQITHQLASVDLLPSSSYAHAHAQAPSVYPFNIPGQEQTHNPPPPPQKTSSVDWHRNVFSQPASITRADSLPVPVTQSLHQPNTPPVPNPSAPGLTGVSSANTEVQTSSPVSYQPVSWSSLLKPRPPTQVGISLGILRPYLIN